MRTGRWTMLDIRTVALQLIDRCSRGGRGQTGRGEGCGQLVPLNSSSLGVARSAMKSSTPSEVLYGLPLPVLCTGLWIEKSHKE